MSESFIRASKVKQDIERHIGELDGSKAYVLSHSDPSFQSSYSKATQLLEEETQAISMKIDQLTQIIAQLQKQIDQDQTMTQESRIIQQKKASNLEGQVRELLVFLRRIHGKKRDQMREEREKFTLYGAGRSISLGDSSSAISQRNREAITSNTRLTNEMLGSGREILHSFRNQTGTLKGVQKKVMNIVNELGISNHIVRLIGSRSRNDNIIILVLSVLLLVFIAVCYYVIRPMLRGEIEE